MDSFQTTAVVMAVAFLLLFLILVGVMLAYPSNSRANVAFPPVLNACPDFWTVKHLGGSGGGSGGGAGGAVCVLPACNSGNNLGTLCVNGNYDLADPNKHLQQDPGSGKVFIDPNAALSSNPVPFCSLADWAGTFGVNWDGVTNNNQC